MNILVCLSCVPDTTSKINFKNDVLEKHDINFIINPYDDYALSRAVELKDNQEISLTVNDSRRGLL